MIYRVTRCTDEENIPSVHCKSSEAKEKLGHGRKVELAPPPPSATGKTMDC